MEITLPNRHIIQYYGYARFEYWPEGDANSSLVRLGDIGADLAPFLVKDLKERYAHAELTCEQNERMCRKLG